ncbi:MAG: phosphatase PAP2 family protein [Oscillospiraceae bacterium]|nr:phosphatase PAP2 family protein [Oscillospiraceae bacterium]
MNQNQRSTKLSTQTLVTCAMLCAAAYAFVFVSHHVMPPMLPAVPFLKYDPKDIVLAFGALLFGPVPAFIMSAVVSLIEMVTISSTGAIGMTMNILSTCAFILPVSIIYPRKKTAKRAVFGLLCGAALMTGAMLLWNYLITPIYMGVPRAAVAGMLIPAFLPFNAIKSLLNTAGTLILYKPVVRALRGARLMPKPTEAEGKNRSATVAVAVFSAAITAACVLVIMILNNRDFVLFLGFDRAVFEFIERIFFGGGIERVLTPVLTFITHLGDSGAIWIALAVALLIFKKTRKYGLAVAFALIFMLLMNDLLLKNLIARPRPFDLEQWRDWFVYPEIISRPGSFAFPSGHTSSSFAAATALLATKKKRAYIPAFVLAALIGFSRIYLHVHYATDVIFGAAVGAALGVCGILLAGLIYKKVKSKSGQS